MTLRQVAWFLAAYVALVAVAMWFNLAILCQGDVKFHGGCGGFGLYIPLWEVFLVPLPIAAILLERWKRSEPSATSRVLAYLAGILVVAEVGFLLIDRFPVLLALEAVAIALASLVRWKRIQRADAPQAVRT
jgi:hypothetical protein